jgi:hypothetical protein
MGTLYNPVELLRSTIQGMHQYTCLGACHDPSKAPPSREQMRMWELDLIRAFNELVRTPLDSPGDVIAAIRSLSQSQTMHPSLN